MRSSTPTSTLNLGWDPTAPAPGATKKGRLTRPRIAAEVRVSGYSYCGLRASGQQPVPLLRSEHEPKFFGQLVPTIGFGQYRKIFFEQFIISSFADVSRCEQYLQFRTKFSCLDCQLCSVHASRHYDVRKHDVDSFRTM